MIKDTRTPLTTINDIFTTYPDVCDFLTALVIIHNFANHIVDKSLVIENEVANVMKMDPFTTLPNAIGLWQWAVDLPPVIEIK